MTGNTAKCDLTTTSNNSVSKFFNLLNSKSALDLIRHKKCQQINQSNTQLRRSFKLLKAHRSESNLPSNHSLFNPIIQSTNNQLDLNTKSQLPKLTKPISTSSLCDLKMKSNEPLSNEPTLLTSAQIANVIADNLENISNNNNLITESPPPTPPIRNSSLRPLINHNSSSILPTYYPNYNRELPSVPINEDKRKSISFSRLSPISDDGGFNSFDFTPTNKRNISVLNNRNLINQSTNYRNNNIINHNQNQINNQQTNNFDKWNNLTHNPFDNPHHNNFQEPNSNLFTNSQRNSYFSDVSDQNLDLDYQNIHSNNYQKSDNWSSSTSVLSTYTGITSSSTSDYYTASSETITNSPSLSSLNSAGLCNSPLIGKSKVSNLTKLYSGQSSLVNNNLQNNNGNKNLSYINHQPQQFPYTGSHLLNNPQSVAKLAKSPLPNTGIAISSLVEKPKRQESASVLYYIVAKDSSTTPSQGTSITNHDLNNKDSQQIVSDKENQLLNNNNNKSSYFNEQFNEQQVNNKNSLNYNNKNQIDQQQLQNQQQQQHNQSDLKAIQKSLHEFYLRHRNNSKDSQIQLENSQQSKSSNDLINNNNSAFHSNLINYSLKSNDSIGSDSSSSNTSSSNSPTLFSSNNHNSNLPMIPLPAKPCFLNKTRTAEEEQKLNKLKAEAIYTNIHYNLLNDLKEDEFNRSSNRLSFRERCTPFENNSPNNNKSNIENKTKNELRNFKNQPNNNVKNIAKQFDGLSNLNANRVSPVSLNKSNNRSIPNGNDFNNLIVPKSKEFNFNKLENNDSFILNDPDKSNNDDEKLDNDLSLENEQLNSKKENGIEKNESIEEQELKSQEEHQQLTEEECKLKIIENDNQIKLLLDYLRKNEMPKIEYNKIVLHIDEVTKVTKLVISLTNRLHKIESILQLRNQQHSNDTNDQSDLNDKFKQSTSTDSLLNDDKNNLFSSILSLSSISLNNLNFNGVAFSTSIEMLNSKKNKILDQIDEAMQLKQMIERRCSNLNNKIICKYLELIQEDNLEFNRLKQFNFVNSMRDKYELSIKFKELDQNARLDK